MKTIKLIPVALSKWIPPVYRVIIGIIVLIITLTLFGNPPPPPPPANLKVMKMGLGYGKVTGVITSSSSPVIDCGGDCDENFGDNETVTLTAVPIGSGSTFLRWEGSFPSETNPITVPVSGAFSVRAVFDLSSTITPLTLADLTPDALDMYIRTNSSVNTPARFISALPLEFKQNWILMSRSESLQTGTAEFPRLLLPSADAKIVFTIGLTTHSSYPGSHPSAIEMMQWDPDQKNFRFHEIILAPILAMGSVPERSTRMVSKDDSKCSKCHSTNNVFNTSAFTGTTGIRPGITLKFKNKPNWDAYDSWGGAMPFNRDRIYQGSVEEAAFRHIFNLWNWRNSNRNDSIRQIIEQLVLQSSAIPDGPHGIIRDTNNITDNGHIRFGFDGLPSIPIAATPSTNHTFGGPDAAADVVNQGGRYVTLRHSDPRIPPDNDDYNDPGSDEGRAVSFFDRLGGLSGNLNQQRIADELISHQFATGSFPIDIRAIALAITKSNFIDDPMFAAGPLRINTMTNSIESRIAGSPLTIDLGFFTSRNGTGINNLFTDTRTREESNPRRKADIQKINLDRTNDIYLKRSAPADPEIGLIQRYGTLATDPTEKLRQLRQEVFRRPIEVFDFAPAINGGVYVDRESYGFNTKRIAVYRYFLEPLGVSVDKWSMGVRGRSRTYTFADVFSSYLNVFQPALRDSLLSRPVMDPDTGLPLDPNDDVQLIKAVNLTLSRLPDANDVPKYTDVQRIFNKSCIECHGGLNYPPYSNYFGILDLSENDTATNWMVPPSLSPRLFRSHRFASMNAGTIYYKIRLPNEDCRVGAPIGLMPCGGPALSNADTATIGRWVRGSAPFTVGDPHIRTIDGVSYDFQAAGEFVLLRGEDLEIQARHKPVATNSPLGPNDHTGLTSCVSINSAVAIRVGRHRITYQPNISGKPDPAGLQLRVDGNLVQMTAQGIPLASDGRIMQTIAPGGIQVETQGGTVIIITPGWWDYYKVWYLDIDTRHVRATEGLMGSIAPGNWLPALPDGSLMGALPDLKQRYRDLYGIFGKAWRVNDTTSLFDYATGTSTKSFTIDNWPGGDSAKNCVPPNELAGIKPLQPLTLEVAQRLCRDIVDVEHRNFCIQDVMATGDSTFVKTYLLADKITRNKIPDAPVLVFPKDFDSVLVSDLTFKWNNTTDKDGGTLTYKLHVWPVNELPDNNNAVPVSTKTGWWSGRIKCASIVGLIGLLLFIVLYFIGLKKKPGLLVLVAIAILAAVIIAYLLCGRTSSFSKKATGLESGKAYFWKVIVEDGQGGTVESETRRFQTR